MHSFTSLNILFGLIDLVQNVLGVLKVISMRLHYTKKLVVGNLLVDLLNHSNLLTLLVVVIR